MPIRPTSFAAALIAAVISLCHTGVYAQDTASIKLRTVVLDAGHGGKDPGAVAAGLREKDINLDVVLKLGAMIEREYPGVKVIYTREKDTYLPLSTRSDIANRNKADLFISVHVNSAKSGSGAGGTETFIMGTDKSASNMEVCRQENSVIMLDSDYNIRYKGFNPMDPASYIFFNLMQHSHFEQSLILASCIEKEFAKGPVSNSRGIKQAPLIVLWKTTMPSVLVEIGFISNPADRSKLSKEGERKRIAACIFDAFSIYKARYEGESDAAADSRPRRTGDVAVPAPSAVSPLSEPQGEAPAPAGFVPVADTTYVIQIMATSNELPLAAPELKSVENFSVIRHNGLYKYVVGNFKNRDEAVENLPRYRELFFGAFIVKVGKNGEILN